MAPSTQDPSTLGSFASVIELRAYVQAEIERLKNDVDNLYKITSLTKEDEARRDERLSNFQRTVDGMSDKVNNLISMVDRLKALDGDGLYKVIEEEINSFKRELENADLRQQLSDAKNPTSLQSISNSLTELWKAHEQKQRNDEDSSRTRDSEVKEMVKKLTELEKSFAEMKLRLTIIVSIAAFAVGKGLDLLLKFISK